MFRIWTLHSSFPNSTSVSPDAIVVCQTSWQEPSPPPLTGSHVIDIRYLSSFIPEWIICPCALCDSLAHFTYWCPLIVAYCGRHSTPIQPHPTTSPLVLHSLDSINITSPEAESLPIPPWFIDRLSEDTPTNPPNSPVNFPQEIFPPTTFYHP
jgi:hypothetical protein